MNAIVFSAVFGVVFMLLGTGCLRKKQKTIQYLAIVAMSLLIAIHTAELLTFPIITYRSDFIAYGSYELFLMLFMALCLLYFLVQNFSFLSAIKAPLPEQIALLFFMLSGGALLLSVNHLLTLFLGIEMVSLPLYIFTGLERRNLKSNESALKYFLTGAFFTGILLMGITLIYGSCGSFDISVIAERIKEQRDIWQLMGITFIMAALCFKVAAVPFHFWTPDVYEGAPTSYTGLMASVVKVFFFIAFFKIFHNAFRAAQSVWITQIDIVLVATLIVSNITALFQNSIKRLMSYSSIAQAAFMLLAIYANNQYASDGLFIYMISYTLAVLGVFAIIHPIDDKPIDALCGLLKKSPLTAVALAVFLFSLIGIPLTGGFIGKYYMILAALSNGLSLYILVLLFVASAVSAFYYLRVLNSAFFKQTDNSMALNYTFAPSKRFQTALLINAFVVILLGVRPSWFLELLNY